MSLVFARTVAGFCDLRGGNMAYYGYPFYYLIKVAGFHDLVAGLCIEKSHLSLVLEELFAFDMTGTTDVSIVVLVSRMMMSVALSHAAVLNYVRVHELVKACFSNADGGSGNNGSGCEWLPLHTVELGNVFVMEWG